MENLCILAKILKKGFRLKMLSGANSYVLHTVFTGRRSRIIISEAARTEIAVHVEG